MQIGIVGLPNVGKSTLFNSLTKSAAAQAENYAFCTIDPNTGIVEVPDQRIKAISDLVKPQKTIYTNIEIVDIAGLVKGANQGEGLGNKFLANIRECHAIAQVIRNFENKNITHVYDNVNPQRDIEIIETELILADLQTIEKKIETSTKDIKAKKDNAKERFEFFNNLKSHLEKGVKASSFNYEKDQLPWLQECHLLSFKPIIYIINVDENELANFQENECKKNLGLQEKDIVVPICAQLEADLADMSDDEILQFLADFGIKDTGRSNLIKKSYELLGLQTFFTAGEKEVRAWTFQKGWLAPQCAGVIHSDFEKDFICTDIIPWQDFVENQGWIKAKENGKIRTEGKDYQMQDGDICFFKCRK